MARAQLPSTDGQGYKVGWRVKNASTNRLVILPAADRFLFVIKPVNNFVHLLNW